MPKRPFILALYGGPSREREVSLTTGALVVERLTAMGHAVAGADVADAAAVESALDQVLAAAGACVVFNALHGTFGEDGGLPSLLDRRRIPYTHSGAAACRLAFHKPSLQERLRQEGFPIAPFLLCATADLPPEAPFLPAVAKPPAEGSSIDVHILRDTAAWQHFADFESRSRPDWFLEAYIPGRELTVTVLQDRALAITDIRTNRDFFDYDAKYQIKTTHVLPADLPPSLTERIKGIAVAIHRLIGARTLSRLDLRYDPQTERLAVLEINTHPGLTPVSLVPEQAAFAGISFEALLTILLEEAAYDAAGA